MRKKRARILYCGAWRSSLCGKAAVAIGQGRHGVKFMGRAKGRLSPYAPRKRGEPGLEANS